MRQKKGFTLLEMMLALGLFAALLVIPIMYTQAAQVRFDFNTQVSVLVSYLRLAQSDSASGKDDMKHGVHLNPDSYVIFSGDAYNPADPANFTVPLPGTMQIVNIALAEGGSDVVFDKVRGETADYGTFDLFSQQINKSLTLTVTPLGTVNY